MAIYYISPTGNDSNDGLTTGTAWQTTAKITAGSFSAGDVIYIEKGGEYGHFVMPNSGSSGNPITINTYGASDQYPKIKASITATGWSDEGGNIWSFQHASLTKDPKMVRLDGVSKQRGKSQNYVITAVSGESWVEVSGGTGQVLPTFDYTGVQVVIRNRRFIWRCWDVSSKSGNRVNYTSDLTGLTAYTPDAGYGFFLQNHLDFLTGDGDWCYDSATDTLYMYFANDDPSTRSIEVSVADVALDISNRSHLVIYPLRIEGGIERGIDGDGASNITLIEPEIRFIGGKGINFPDGSTSNITLSGGSIHDCHGSGYDATYLCANMVLEDAKIYDCGVFPGAQLQAGNGDSQGCGAIMQLGSGNVIRRCKFTNIGFNPIVINGNGFICEDNFGFNFNISKDDGAGIYCSLGNVFIGEVQYQLTTEGQIRRNTMINGVGNPVCTDNPASVVFGIYMDDMQNLVRIEYNHLINNAGAGIYFHNCLDITARYNWLFGNKRAFNYSQDSGMVIRGLVVTDNEIYQDQPDQFLVSCLSVPPEDVALFGTINNNHYHYVESNQGLFEFYGGDKYSYGLSFDEWNVLTDQEADSTCEAFQNQVPDSYTVAATLFTQTYPSEGSVTDFAGGGFVSFGGGTRTWDGERAVLTKTLSGKRDAYMRLGEVLEGETYVLTLTLSNATDEWISINTEKLFDVPFNAFKAKRVKATSAGVEYKLLFVPLEYRAGETALFLMESDFDTIKVDNVTFERLSGYVFESGVEAIYNETDEAEVFSFASNRRNLQTDVVALDFTLEPGESAFLQKTTDPVTQINIRVFAKFVIV